MATGRDFLFGAFGEASASGFPSFFFAIVEVVYFKGSSNGKTAALSDRAPAWVITSPGFVLASITSLLENHPSRRDIIVIGASAGGIEAVSELLSRLPDDFAAAIFIVVHQSPTSSGILAQVFANASRFDVRTAEDNSPFQEGVAYVAPPDFHLLIEEKTIRVIQGPRENRHRPAIDTLFRSAAINHGPRVIAVILSGYLDDGSAGLAAIKSQGGIAIVQDPADAMASGMPEAALRAVKADHVARIEDIPAILVDGIRARVEMSSPLEAEPLEQESELVEMAGHVRDMDHPGAPSEFSCPDCSGVLWEMADHDVLRFRCRIGHAYSVETLVHAQEDDVEEALWSALNVLDESATLSRRLSLREQERGNIWSSERFAERAGAADRRAETIRRVLMRRSAAGQESGDPSN